MPILQDALLAEHSWPESIKSRGNGLVSGDPHGHGSATIAVSVGAALVGADSKHGSGRMILSDVLANDLSVVLANGTLEVLVEHGTPLPTSHNRIYRTAHDGQTQGSHTTHARHCPRGCTPRSYTLASTLETQSQ